MGSGRVADSMMRLMPWRSEITRTNVQWILDADLAEFFESVSHSWLFRLLEHRQV